MRRQLGSLGPLGISATAALLLSACSGEQGPDGSNVEADAATKQFVNRMAGAAPPPSAPTGKPFEQSDKGELLEFVYAYPAQAAAVPPLVARFDKEREQSKADALKMARNDQDAAKRAGFPFRPHSLEKRWAVTADTPRFLSLQATSYFYTGGAHGMTGYEAILWDKQRKQETRLDALMTSSAAFASAIRANFCTALDKQRAEKRGGPVTPGEDDFSKCIDPMKEVLVPRSSDGKAIDAVAVVIGPYSAGPYAEGSYEVVLPVDAAMRKAIKEEFRDAFAPAA